MLPVGALFDLLLGDQFLPFQFTDLVLIGRDHAGIGGIQNALQITADLRFDLSELALQRLASLIGLFKALVPRIGKHGLGDLKHALCRGEVFEDLLKITFQLVPSDGFSITLTALLSAHIVWMTFARLRLRPTGREGMITIIAEHEAPQREVFTDVFPCRSFRLGFKTLLDFLESRKGDQPFMLPFAQGHIPTFGFDISGICHIGEHVIDMLVPDMPA